MRRTLLYSLTVLVVAAADGRASKVKVWHQSKPAQFEKARLTRTVVSNEGTLRLSRQLKPLAALEATHVWDLVEDKKGNLYAATGDAGKIYKIGADGKATVVFTSDDGQVLCLALSPDGSVYAGTGPAGRVVRIDPEGNARVIHEGLDNYVWSLAVDAKGEAVYAGTGPKGKVYKLTPEGKATVFYASKQEHILCVAVGNDGNVYAGTDKNGLVYKIDAKGKAFVLYQAPQAEVRTLQVTADGVYFGTSSPRGGKRSSAGSLTSSGDVAARPTRIDSIAVAETPKKGEDETNTEKAPAGKTPAKDEKEDDKPKTAPAPSAPSSGDNSLYRIAPDGTVREVFRESAMVLSLLKQKGRFFVGTGMNGKLFEVDEQSRERTEIARLDHGQILCMVKRADGSVVLGTGDPGKLYVLQDKYESSGSIVSEVLDAKIVSKWGSLRWQAVTPEKTRVTVAVRSGNVAEPDETWSDWSLEQTDADKATVAAPTARFLQYRITLATENPDETPGFRSIAIRFATTNQAPEVTKLESPNLDAADLDSAKKLKFKWTAEDANEDALTYSVWVRKDGWKNWVRLEDDLEKTEFEWDTTGTPSGHYQLKVVASDRKDNSEGEALTGTRISDAFVVSHVPPSVKLKVVGIEGDQAVLEATVSSDLVRLTSASFALNGKKWVNVFPADGLFDSKAETFRFKTDALEAGTYVVVVRVKDAAGNTGSGDVVFSVNAKGEK